MDAQIKALIEAIHDAPTQAALAVSGGGSQALAWLLSVPGASRTVLEVTLPYSEAAFEQFVREPVAQFVSVETARLLAATAYRRARLLAEDGVPVIGAAITATLVTDRPKRGEHRFHVAMQDEAGVSVYSLTLVKGARGREEEEALASRVLLCALAESAGVAGEVDLPLLPEEHVVTARHDAPDRLLQVLRGDVPAVMVNELEAAHLALPRGAIILPGSFNPLHGGHWQLAHVAAQMLHLPFYFELSVQNVDKPPLRAAEVLRRVGQFAHRGRVIVTGAPLFAQKAELLPESVFLVGVDTAVRLVSPRYYPEGDAGMLESLAVIRAAGCRFLVAGRMVEGRFRTLDDVDVPAEFAGLFTPIPPERFRADISSTELRELYQGGE